MFNYLNHKQDLNYHHINIIINILLHIKIIDYHIPFHINLNMFDYFKHKLVNILQYKYMQMVINILLYNRFKYHHLIIYIHCHMLDHLYHKFFHFLCYIYNYLNFIETFVHNSICNYFYRFYYQHHKLVFLNLIHICILIYQDIFLLILKCLIFYTFNIHFYM